METILSTSAKKIGSFTDLYTWQKGHELVLMIYKVTATFPKAELFGLTSQLRRAAVSITSNIAEGFRRPSFKDKAQFYSIAMSSLTEVQNQLLIARDVGYLSGKVFFSLNELAITISKLGKGLVRKTLDQI